jgi:hypothetical protein
MTTLGELVMDAIKDPEGADTASLPREASAFLKTAVGGDPDLLWLGRNLAYAAVRSPPRSAVTVSIPNQGLAVVKDNSPNSVGW